MTPNRYFNEQYNDDLSCFIKTVQSHDNNEGTWFSLNEIVPENFEKAQIEQKDLFVYFLTLDVLFDELIYTYHQEVYPEYFALSNIPNIEYGLTYAHIVPWHIIREAQRHQIIENHVTNVICESCVQVYMKHLIKNISSDESIPLSLAEVVESLNEDKEIKTNALGKIVIAKFRKVSNQLIEATT